MTSGNNRLEQLIDDIYEYIDGCKSTALSSSKIIVQKDELLDLVDELKARTPDEIKKYQKIIANQDVIIARAEKEAASILSAAQEESARLLSESEIMQQAYRQANSIVSQANEEANRIRAQVKEETAMLTSGAYDYTNQLLDMLESVIDNAHREAKVQFDGLLNTLNNSLTVVRENKKEMEMSEPSTTPKNNDSNDDDFDFDADAFIENIDL